MSIVVGENALTGKHITVESLDRDPLFSLPTRLRGTNEPDVLSSLIYEYVPSAYDGWNAYTPGRNWIGCSEV